MKRSGLVVLASLALCACSDKNNDSSNITSFDPDMGSVNNTSTGDMTPPGADTSDPADATNTTDDMAEELDFGVAAEGFMHGNWLAARAAGGEIATLRIRHEAGETSVAGTFQMTEPPSFGQLGGSNWLNDQFTTSWTVAVDGIDQRFGLAMCTGTNDELNCRYTDALIGDIVDATLTRQN